MQVADGCKIHLPRTGWHDLWSASPSWEELVKTFGCNRQLVFVMQVWGITLWSTKVLWGVQEISGCWGKNCWCSWLPTASCKSMHSLSSVVCSNITVRWIRTDFFPRGLPFAIATFSLYILGVLCVSWILGVVFWGVSGLSGMEHFLCHYLCLYRYNSVNRNTNF